MNAIRLLERAALLRLAATLDANEKRIEATGGEPLKPILEVALLARSLEQERLGTLARTIKERLDALTSETFAPSGLHATPDNVAAALAMIEELASSCEQFRSLARLLAGKESAK